MHSITVSSYAASHEYWFEVPRPALVRGFEFSSPAIVGKIDFCGRHIVYPLSRQKSLTPPNPRLAVPKKRVVVFFVEPFGGHVTLNYEHPQDLR